MSKNNVSDPDISHVVGICLNPRPLQLNLYFRIPLWKTILSENHEQRISRRPSLSSLVCCLINSVCAVSQRLIPLVPLMCKRQGEGIQRTHTEQIDHKVVLSMAWGRSSVSKDNTVGQLSCIIGKGLLVDLCRMKRLFLKHCIHV